MVSCFYQDRSVMNPNRFLAAKDIRRARVRHAHIRVIYCELLRAVGKGNRTGARRFAWLILTKVGTNSSRGRRRSAARRRRPVEDRWTTSGCPSGLPRYNNSSCQSHPSRSNRFDSGRGEDGTTGAYVKDKTKGASGRGVGRFAVSFLFSFSARSWFRTPAKSCSTDLPQRRICRRKTTMSIRNPTIKQSLNRCVQIYNSFGFH